MRTPSTKLSAKFLSLFPDFHGGRLAAIQKIFKPPPTDPPEKTSRNRTAPKKNWGQISSRDRTAKPLRQSLQKAVFMGRHQETEKEPAVISQPTLGPRKSPRSQTAVGPLRIQKNQEGACGHKPHRSPGRGQRLIFQTGPSLSHDLKEPAVKTVQVPRRRPAVIFQPTLGPLERSLVNISNRLSQACRTGHASCKLIFQAALFSSRARLIFQTCTCPRCTGRRPLADALYTSSGVPGATEV